MTKRGGRGDHLLWVMLTACVLATAACSASRTDSASTTAAPPPSHDEIDDRYDLPAEARTAEGGGQPRTPGYWAVWNTCAPGNRSEEAAANGGRAAGWVLVDDVLADPGLQLGEYRPATCEESVALLEGRMTTGDATADPVYALAAQLLAAELNLNVGAESCPAAEEAILGSHLILVAAGFEGTSSSPLDAESEGALPRLVELLAAYNTGALCR